LGQTAASPKYSLFRKRLAISLLVTIAISILLVLSPLSGLRIATTEPTPNTLGQVIGFNFTIDVQDDETTPIRNVTLEIYNSALPGTYNISCTNLPLTATTRVYSTSGGQVTIATSPGPSRPYGYGPAYIACSASWASPANWPTGQYAIKITVAADGTTFEQTRMVMLVGVPPVSPNLTMEVRDPRTGAVTTSGEVRRGKEVKLTISVKAVQGFTRQVTLSVSGLPEMVTATFDPTSGTPNFTSDLTILTGKKTKPGNYELTIKASSNGLSHTFAYTLKVTGKSYAWLGILLLLVLLVIGANVLYVLYGLSVPPQRKR